MSEASLTDREGRHPMSDAHTRAYRLARHRIDAELRRRHADDVVVFRWGDDSLSIFSRAATEVPAASDGRVPVIVYVNGIPRRIAEHPLPERRAATPLRRAQ